MAKIQAVRGINDILPAQARIMQALESAVREIFEQYDYQRIILPILEKTELFQRSIGEVTDVVEKEMYSFVDRNGESLTLRPEGTAGCVRAAIEHGLLHHQTQRFWYMGPMFRHERPQKGRYRQFYQIGVEAFGLNGPYIDAEMLAMLARLWKKIGLSPYVKLQINSLGTLASRMAYRDKLVAYFSTHQWQLDEDSQRRLHSNPLRILDSKNPAMRELIEKAPKLTEHLDAESLQHFNLLKSYLDNIGIEYEVNPYLVRGLDYYSHTVFEWVTDSLGAQGTVCAGGRFNGLVEKLGGGEVPAIGFAMGVERLLLLMETYNLLSANLNNPDIYLILAGERAEQFGFKLAEQLRDAFPQLKIMMNIGQASFKNQFKRADKSGARIAVIIGEDEMASAVASIKHLREELPQQVVGFNDLLVSLASIFAGSQQA
ncbi:MAG: histidyl-tRNA synthetase [Gammaproteobacteria bacterium]|jgi:histidyl-tRNA synthetase|nr:histidyl-tRNA synthetase [Gammaproteobacteria bacterium]